MEKSQISRDVEDRFVYDVPHTIDFNKIRSYEELPLYLSPKEVAAFYRIPSRLAYDLAEAGELPVLRFGSKLRVVTKKLQEYEELMIKLSQKK